MCIRDRSHRHQQIVVGYLSRIDDLDLLAGAQLGKGSQPSQVGVSPSAGAEDGRTDRGRCEGFLGYLPHLYLICWRTPARGRQSRTIANSISGDTAADIFRLPID